MFSCCLRLILLAKIQKVLMSPSFERLVNVAIVSGKNVSMSCQPSSSSSPVTWYHIPVHSEGASTLVRFINKGAVLYQGFSEYSLSGIAPGEVLSLKDTRLSHAGLYKCSTEGQQATAHLIVLASQPDCNFAFDQSRLHLVCSVMHSDNWIPSMRWFITTNANGAKLRIISENNCSSASHSVGSSNISIAFNSLKSESIFVFKLNFDNSFCSKANSTATNIPNYEFTWKLPIAQITNYSDNVFVLDASTSLAPATIVENSSGSTGSSAIHDSYFLPVVIVLAFFPFVMLIVFASVKYARMSKATRRNSDQKYSLSATNGNWPDSATNGLDLSSTLSDDTETQYAYASVDRSKNWHQYTGTDGTVYLKLKGLNPNSQIPDATLSTNTYSGFNKSEYISIDHCLTPLPAPPR